MSLTKKKCIPCEGYSNPLSDSEEDKFLSEVKNWKVFREGEHRIIKEYSLIHFRDSISFVNKIADLSENEGHHPNITIKFNTVIIEINTHAIKGLSENDFILAAKIDEIYVSDYEV